MTKDERKNREYEQRRAHIIAHAEVIFAANGFHKTTMAQIATASGFATGSLYQFFDSKEDLLVTMVSERMEAVSRIVTEAVETQPTSLQKIGAFIGAQFASVQTSVNLLDMLIRGEMLAVARTSTRLRNDLFQKTERHIAIVEKILQQGVEENLFSGDIDRRVAAMSLLGSIRFFIFYWMVTGRNFDLAEKTASVQKTFIDGVKKR